eukprot:m.125873 g.125873  ORF g.125873 m.125873 type:complete len:54 (-) comp17343_c0_seq3:142-303(-)
MWMHSYLNTTQDLSLRCYPPVSKKAAEHTEPKKKLHDNSSFMIPHDASRHLTW